MLILKCDDGGGYPSQEEIKAAHTGLMLDGKTVFWRKVSCCVEVASNVPGGEHREEECLDLWVSVVFPHPFPERCDLCLPVFDCLWVLTRKNMEGCFIFFPAPRAETMVLVVPSEHHPAGGTVAGCKFTQPSKFPVVKSVHCSPHGFPMDIQRNIKV